MASISVDTSEVRTLAADMRAVDSRMARHLTPVVKRGAQNIKDDHAAKVRQSSWFRFAGQVSYDILDGGFTAEIGPRAEGAGRLENIAYFGGSNGGGGTVEDPQAAGDRELPNFSRALAEAAEGLIFG